MDEWQNRDMITLYGIPNCDTVKKARAWLDSQGLAYTFHNFKRQGVPLDRIPVWSQALGWERLINRQGMTWQKLTDKQKADAGKLAGAMALMQAESSVIKRPIVEWQDPITTTITLGFDTQTWSMQADELKDNERKASLAKAAG